MRRNHAPVCLRGASALRITATFVLVVAASTALARSQGFLTKVRFANLTPHQRVDWGTATIPFPESVWTPGRTYHVPGFVSEITPFGSLWPDGSVRFGQLSLWLKLDPGEERVYDIREGTPLTPAYALSPWVQYGLQFFDMQLTVGIPNSHPVTVRIRPVGFVSSTELKKVAYFQGRVPGTDIVYDLWLTSFSNGDHMPFELRITNSDAASQKWQQDVDYIDLTVTGASPHIYGRQRKGIPMPQLTAMGPNRVRLMGKQALFDGQGQEWVGEFLFYHPNITLPGGPTETNIRELTLGAVLKEQLWGVSTDWAASETYGPFGFVPPPPPWVTDGGRLANLTQRASYLAWLANDGGPWLDWPFGLLPRPAAPGDQHDFGAAKLIQIVSSGMPFGVEEARMNASEEANRPVHHREPDGSPVTSANHPNWVAWDGRTHFSNSLSPDRLGKPYPAAPVAANGWYGRDTEHWSSLVLAGAYLLTGSHSLRYELDNEAELFLATRTLPSQKPGFASNGMGAARAVGRIMLSMAWNYMVTGNDAVRARMDARIDEVVSQSAEGLRVSGPVKPIAVREPDVRLINVQNWRPWEESLGIIGLEACYRVTNNPKARQIAVMAARTLAHYGWLTNANTTIIGTALAWKARGVPLGVEELASPAFVLWSFGTGFNEWAVSATRLALEYAVIYGDPTLLTRANYIYRVLLSKRQQPQYSIGWDRFSEWEAAW